MDIKELQKNWNTFGKMDPLWAILTDNSKRGNKWDLKDFFELGENEINEVMNSISVLNLDLKLESALDFGCGAGRLTQALANKFDRVSGVDISPSMIDLSEKYNRHGDKCKYYLNAVDNLSLFSDQSFDFIYSSVVLQHMRPDYAKSYIKEFIRLLSPKGLLVFQLPGKAESNQDLGKLEKLEEKIEFESKATKIAKKILPNLVMNLFYSLKGWPTYAPGEAPVMEVYVIARSEVERFIAQNGGRTIDVQSCGPEDEVVSWRYYVTLA
jgi:ubiquinone/menaquinone biosynthesis C-methylase UbiE